ncbi:hypothetical protein B0H67DRAFT_580160 [Lasiosphaeris hirsuta]|uniref:Uncharacterized protein n=1 Tax=Lasiosphaeris hirsuta TaxID=260670 RepID=A0AA40AG22_9PEZI|nr:hypothetical protein B0H67DRAFT_580160 [Lasiosphaeris hirsuta]
MVTCLSGPDDPTQVRQWGPLCRQRAKQGPSELGFGVPQKAMVCLALVCCCLVSRERTYDMQDEGKRKSWGCHSEGGGGKQGATALAYESARRGQIRTRDHTGRDHVDAQNVVGDYWPGRRRKPQNRSRIEIMAKA